MKNISAWAIRHPILPLVLFLVLLFLGVSAFIRLPINLNPDISFPLVMVSVSQPGAAPTEIETQVMQKIDGAVASVGNVREITSRAIEGQSLTFVEFQIGTPVDRAVNDVRDAVAKVRSELPDGIEEPVVQREDAEGGAIAYFAVSTTDMTAQELSWFVDNTITKRLLAVPGIAQVTRGGGVDREIRVELDPARMQALGITAVEVNQQLRQLNIDAPGGRAQVGGGEQAIRVLGGAKSAFDLGETRIAVPGGRVVRLKDIADVHDGVAEVRSLARFNGRDATTFGLRKSKGSSDVTVIELVNRELDQLRKEFPRVSIKMVYTTVKFTQQTYDSAIDALLEGSLLAVLVVFLFLRDLRATAISALAIPLSAIPTFFFMQWMGFTLNQISLLALSLVAGVLVDDAIVEIENIVRHMRSGKSAWQAALDAADEIGLAVVATSATIIAVFLPVSFMGGVTGQFFRQFGLTVAVAVFMSLLVARLITPLVAAYTLKSHGKVQQGDGPIMTWYLGFLRRCVQHRWLTIAGGVVFFVLSVLALATLPQSFIPTIDQSSTALNIEMPPGVRLEDTAAVSARVTAMVRKQPEVTDVVESVGSDDVRSATLYINLVPPRRREVTQAEWERRMIGELRAVPDARISFQSQHGGLGRDITLFITGEDSDVVQRTADTLVEEMRTLAELRDPRINGDLPRPEIVIRPRLDLAADLGVTVASIGQTVRIATLGDLAQNGARFSLADRQVPIRVSLVEAARADLTAIENLPVPTAGGGAVPLKAVADISFGQGPSTVRRYNQSRRVAIEADRNGVEPSVAMEKIKELPIMKHMPQGVRLIEKGDAEMMNELRTNFVLAIAAGVLMVFAVLVVLFARVFQPITILSALPLSIGGAALALILAGQALSLPAMIGVLMLLGIVAKNSILLVDFAIEEMRAGRDQLTALLESGHKRARPIVMTTVAMVAGMLPVALNISGSSSFRVPMGIAVIGGLITSTALTLVVVPAVFTVIDDLERRAGPWFRRALTKEEAGAAAAKSAQG
ncbi:MAG TPA: efflux RND transporter permease subunit [Steroidobacteraceae bacterium]|nr:efflux RND transporter permease subunit [Steroidobacteraceae bacterium]HQZ80864.1 efflux RND transporter permease subunit [Steroidobacteraceae bacterium]